MKIKAVLALLLALVIIILGAMLPQLVGRRQDRAQEELVLFRPMSAVELEFATYSNKSHSEVLALLCQSRDSVAIPQELASQKREKVVEIALDYVDKYAQAGILLSDLSADEVLSCQAWLHYGPNNQNNIYWQIQYGDKAGKHLLTMTVDDLTGTVCSVEYADTEETYAPDNMEPAFRGFVRLYLAGLGEDFFVYPVEDIYERAKTPDDRSYIAAEFYWEDPAYGTNRITFFVNQNGFYTYLK